MSTYQPGEYSRVSIREHAASRNTDQLYEPLRETFLNPQNIQKHAALTPLVTRSSAVSHEYKILSQEELQRLEQNILIPNVPLYPTHNLTPVRNEKFIAVDASERIIGAPITPEELERIRNQGFRKQEILYDFKAEPDFQDKSRTNVAAISSRSVNLVNSPKSQKLKAAPPPLPLQPVQEQVVYEYQQAQRYTTQNFEDYGKQQIDYKYNLFSAVDEPFNKCREFGFSGCTSCPGNEVIASRNRPLSLTWQ